MKRQERKKWIYVILFVIGNIAGIILFYLQNEFIRYKVGEYLRQCALNITYIDYDLKQGITDIFGLRSVQACGVLYFLYKSRNVWLLRIVTVVLAGAISLFICSMLYTFGWRGIVLLLILFLPHGIAYFLFIRYGVYKFQKKENNKLCQRYTSLCRNLFNLLEWICLLLCFLVGGFLESCLTPYLLHKMCRLTLNL